MNKYLPLAAANEFIELSKPTGGVTHMQLQKLVYLTHEAWLQGHNESFLSENPQVWQYGPVFASLYHDLKKYRRMEIKDLVKTFDFTLRIAEEPIKSAIAETWKRYGDKSGIYLSELTHRVGTPWRNIAERYKYQVPSGREISADEIKHAYR